MRIILVVVFFASAYHCAYATGCQTFCIRWFSDDVTGTNNVLVKVGDDNDVVNDVAEDDTAVSDDVDYNDNDVPSTSDADDDNDDGLYAVDYDDNDDPYNADDYDDVDDEDNAGPDDADYDYNDV